MTQNLLNRFLSFVQIHSTAKTNTGTTPSSSCQLDFAKFLKEECIQLGLSDITLDDNGYLMATLPSNITTTVPTIGFISHLDTAPDFPGENVKPQVVANYNGEPIILNAKENIILSPEAFPILKEKIGETLITTDGTTLLGADDKSGIAEILTALEYLLAHPEIPHGKIRICFTPDEEIGHGADHFDVSKFGADFAFTIDGGDVGELQIESFHAASAKITVHGTNVHPGTAKNKMKNSMTLATIFHQLVPQEEVPEKTEGREGFYHLTDMIGTVEKTTLEYILRDFDKTSFKARKDCILSITQDLNKKYGTDTFDCKIVDQYANMYEVLKDQPSIGQLAENAMNNLHITPKKNPIRGGTDGSRLSFMGLPCPNLFTGGYNFHGKYEFAVLSEMELATRTIIEIIRLNVAQQ